MKKAVNPLDKPIKKNTVIRTKKVDPIFLLDLYILKINYNLKKSFNL